MWQPKEIIIHEMVKDDPVTTRILDKCPGVPIKWVQTAKPTAIVESSEILKHSQNRMLDKILAGKQVLFISPASNATVDKFTMPDDRMICPHFDRLKLASNGCFYQCDWCYLKLTYRAAFPFITVRTQYEKIANQIIKRLSKSNHAVIFNSGELADSLALEHLTGAAQWFVPWFAKKPNAYLFMLTKSDNVDEILNLDHNDHTIVTWSINNEKVSRKFEIGAPSFERRLAAAQKVQAAGYPVRVRLDPIVPIENWKRHYAETVKKIFQKINPERITLGTLRFEEGFYKMRNTFFTTGPELPSYLADMKPMFSSKIFSGEKKPKSGKYSFDEQQRTDIFNFTIAEIKKYSDCKIALCKESASVWQNVGLELSRCSCVCQLDFIDMENH